ncbi:proline/betaine transporter ProP6 [Legionella nautarum]|uniref:Proline/betaine transporter ProP6 n=1 Tax=Legionella nautarum TaxID=45070 RepID=A0A0W0WRX7_9GAMM|nr:MFS transporter [Legionella nautarum]KTD35068.1 proline/betaine transporter ProP6 [Legionella nautarum]
MMRHQTRIILAGMMGNLIESFDMAFTQSVQYAKTNKLQALFVFILSCLGVTTTSQIFLYAPIQAHIYGTFSEHEIMMSNIISLIVLLWVFPIVGRLSDKINREKIVIVASIGFLFLSQPFFYFLSSGDFYQLAISQALIAIPAGAYYATVPVMLAEMFPINLRCTVLSVLYSVAASLSAGLTPLISLILVEKTGVTFSPSLIVLLLVFIVFICLYIQAIKSKNIELLYASTKP